MRILITGGTGSLGNALVEKLLKRIAFTGTAIYDDGPVPIEPDTIIIYSRDEQKQEQMREKFNNDPRLRFFIGDVRDKERLKLAVWECDVIIHAAALKIVPMLEYNPMEALKTNVIGAQNLIETVYEKSYTGTCTRVLVISTDKAVNPINLYGASKLCAEKLFIAANNIYRPCLFSVVRYGNVAGSRGSVIPYFQEKINKAKFLRTEIKLPVTDERMTRFWITLEEARDFVLHCLDRMKGKEVFIPNMDSFRIIDLANIMTNNYEVVGIRPGEKLHETIISEEESVYTILNKHFGYYKILDGLPNSEYENNITGEVKSNNYIMPKETLKDKITNLGVKQLYKGKVDGLDD